MKRNVNIALYYPIFEHFFIQKCFHNDVSLSLSLSLYIYIYIYIYMYMLPAPGVEHSGEGINGCHSHNAKLFV